MACLRSRSAIAAVAAAFATVLAWGCLVDHTSPPDTGSALLNEAIPAVGLTAPTQAVVSYGEALRLLAEAEPSPIDGHAHRVSGHVLDQATGRPVPDVVVTCEVILAKGSTLPEQETSARTSAEGAFTIDLPSGVLKDSVCRATVADSVHEILFVGNVQMTDGLVLLVPSELRMHGVISGVDAACDRAVGFVLVQELGMGKTRNLGQGMLDLDGAFSVRCRGADAQAPVKVRTGCGSTVYSWGTDVSVLSSAEGFRAILRPRRCVVMVVDELGAPVAGATVAVSPPDIGRNGTVVQVLTDARGIAVLQVMEDPVLLVAVAAANRRQVHQSIRMDSWPGELRVTLVGLGAGDVLEGVVRDDMGRPCPNAVVTALPASDASLLRVIMPAQTRATEDGRFSLAVGGDCAFDVTAFAKQHGMSETLRVHPPVRDAELLLHAARTVRIHAVASGTDAVSRGGGIEWTLMKRDSRSELVGSGEFPFVTEPVPLGAYNLAVLWREAGLFAEAPVDIVAGEGVQELVAFLTEPLWFEGRVQAPGSVGLQVRHRHRAWTTAPIAGWTTSPCGVDGSFRVLAGKELSGDLEVVDAAGSVVGRGRGRAGVHVNIVVH